MCLFSFSAIAKIIYPYPFYSYVISFFKYFQINGIFYLIPNKYITILLLAIVIFIEVLIIYFLFISEVKADIIIIFFLIIGLAITISFNLIGIPEDCGCFGRIIVIPNGFYHIIILSVLLIMACTALFLNVHLKYSVPVET